MSGRHSELGEFLKVRRAEIGPREAGLPDVGTRRVPGLRREEVALLAAISTDYYTRIEQGRIRASEPVLEAIARVLQLDEDHRGYLFELAGKDPAPPRRRTAQRVQPQLRRLLDDLTTTPAVVLGRRMDVLEWNRMAAALIIDFGGIPVRHRNFVRLAFLEPSVRALYPQWDDVGHMCVAQLRREAAHAPEDPRLAELVGELSVRDEDFRRWWGTHHVATRSVGTKLYRHPDAGDLTLDWDTLTCTTDPEQQLVVWTAEPGSRSEEGLRFLASWTAADRDRVGETTSGQ
ncbi:helix-turn-helix transcriptional regulator [Pseudonocardia sp. C8]|uniref:helix-turn-helix domain-containing protein n=1 Tax=Pseudonocardia sp. C8 TaxID=2762759 RepID=UPI00164341CE|nr:helix-turn-helix domain-containing protein [Pseudonocardia sp. C8]MBC3191759.1 helix-turn-helix transcriptional regulator [Pseudonocardia sp. C8]